MNKWRQSEANHFHKRGGGVMQFTVTCSLRTEELSETFTLENTNRMENPNKLLSLGKSSSGLFAKTVSTSK